MMTICDMRFSVGVRDSDFDRLLTHAPVADPSRTAWRASPSTNSRVAFASARRYSQPAPGTLASKVVCHRAAAIGTSHRMLNYHFGSRRGLLVAVSRAVERQQREAFVAMLADPDASPIDVMWRMYGRLADPGLHAPERLFFELYAHSLLEEAGTAGFFPQVVEFGSVPSANFSCGWAFRAQTPMTRPAWRWRRREECCSTYLPQRIVSRSMRRWPVSSVATNSKRESAALSRRSASCGHVLVLSVTVGHGRAPRAGEACRG